MGDRIAMERLAKQKIRDEQTRHANQFVSQFSEKSLEEIAGAWAEPFISLPTFWHMGYESPIEPWLAPDNRAACGSPNGLASSRKTDENRWQ